MQARMVGPARLGESIRLRSMATGKQPSWRGDKRNSNERGYTYQWQKARLAYLQANPLCVYCAALKPRRVVAATVVDHVVPHQGDQELFWSVDNWQALCAPCHNGVKAEEEGRHRVKVKFDAAGRVVW